ncbi:MAG TPA: serine hydrolase domain-containing protein [Nocardioides sp.]|nr:serine hydrolase domain-containing protein [Nocardioides sp.]
MMRQAGHLTAALVLGVVAAVLPLGLASPVSAADAVTTVVTRYRERIPELMAEQGVPGLAVAVVGADRVLWTEGFGYRDHEGGEPVTTDTTFSVQSMSKIFTATAVMQAVASGRLDLDEPITTYLPDFTVHSAFEKHPERRITLRMLLSHTAGLTHEAPVGNNNEVDPAEFDAHVESISETWLRFPVGSGYAYSNLGIDLAASILEQVEGEPFAELVHDTLLAPLGMDHSTFDRTVIRSTVDRAIGHVDPYPAPPVDVAMTAAGGLYSSASDLARFLRFQLDDGSIDGRTVLDDVSMKEMRTIPAPNAGAPAGYALGVGRTRWNRWAGRPDLFFHGGGGYGFLADLWWLPGPGVGIAILTNSQDHGLQQDLALSILADLLSEPGVYRDRVLALPSRPPVVDPGRFEPPAGLADLVAEAAMAPTGDEDARWAAYAGLYRAPVWDVIELVGPPDRFVVEGGVPWFEEVTETESLVRHRLVEVAPGRFLAENGETLDLSGPVPTWRSLRLVRVTGGPSAWEWGGLGIAALLAAAWLVAASLRRLPRRVPRSEDDDQPDASRRWRRVAALTALITAVLVFGNAALVAWVPRLVDSGFLGWADLPLAERLALHLPLALAVLAACTVVLVAAGWARRWWSSPLTVQYVILALAAVAMSAQLGTWHLIGWGVT